MQFLIFLLCSHFQAFLLLYLRSALVILSFLVPIHHPFTKDHLDGLLLILQKMHSFFLFLYNQVIKRNFMQLHTVSKLYVPRYHRPGESYPCHHITPFQVLQFTIFWYPTVIPIASLTHAKHSSWIINKVKKDSLHHPHSCLPLLVTHHPQDQFQDSITCLQSSNWSHSSIHL